MGFLEAGARVLLGRSVASSQTTSSLVVIVPSRDVSQLTLVTQEAATGTKLSSCSESCRKRNQWQLTQDERTRDDLNRW